MSGRLVLCAIGSAVLSMCAMSPAFAVPNLPSQFTWDEIAPGAGWIAPVGVAFFPGGRMLVAEKAGRVYTVTNNVKSASPLWQMPNDVLDNGDRGLLGIAVDPRYNGTTNRWIYLMYTVDPDSNTSETNDDSFGRLIRVQVSATDSNTVDYSSRQVLFGQDWRRGPVSASSSHTIGALRWGTDGSLIVSIGDGAQFNGQDAGGQDPNAFSATRTDPNEDIGAFRSQDITSLAGKILRLNPDTGQGYDTNPYWDGNPSSVRSRVWAYGVRNPYRFCVKPGSGFSDPALGNPGTLYIGDVGHTTYEETDIAKVKGLNFGWPCYEGFGAHPLYPATNPAHNGCGSFGTATNPAFHSVPSAAWHHSNDALSTPTGFHGNTAIGGSFYMTNRYPTQYRGQYFFGDYGQSWMKVAVMDGNDNLIQVLPFGTGMDGPVDFNRDPVTGDIIYVAINVGQVRRIRYTGATGGNTNPIATASATPTNGAAPLAVAFSSQGSFDVDGDALSFSWAFGDGTGSLLANPAHSYALAGTYTAQLTVNDGRGGIDVRSLAITVTDPATGFPSTAVLDNFNRANGALGGSWVGQTSGLIVSNNQMSSSSGAAASPVWNGQIFGVDQEAYFTFNAINVTAPEHDLMLKVQGTSYTGGHIEVRYTAALNHVAVSTYTQATSWVDAGPLIPVTFAAGDQFGARVLGSGVIEVFKNGVKIGTGNTGTWPYTASGGRLGMTVDGIAGSLLDNFGGGNVVFNSNTKPTATILSPANNSFFITGQVINLAGNGSDNQTPSDSLTYNWVMDLHHNTHVHAGWFSASGKTATLIGENHDDGTGVYDEIKLIVTDKGGLRDTARVNIYPEIDLSPSVTTVTPPIPTAGQPATYSFRLRNYGRMPAQISRWVLRAGNTLIAQGDTLVAPLDSVTITRTATLTAGTYALRARADSLGTVFETLETNNASTVTLTVNPAPGNNAPLASASGNPLTGQAPLAVAFSSAGSSDPDGDPITFGWNFGDGQTSTAANVSHTYTNPGNYTATLTVSDNRGGSGTATVAIVASPPPGGGAFPATAVLDNFNRANGPIGALWETSNGFTVTANQLKTTKNSPNTTWNGAIYGVNQEAYITFATLDAAAIEHILMLKVQGHFWHNGHIEVNYDRAAGVVRVATFAPSGGWVDRGTVAATFASGDQMGARARSTGVVTIYKNGTALGTVSVAGWAYAANTGRIGMAFTNATACAYDNFGGGDAPATEPAAIAARNEAPASELETPSLPRALSLSAPYPNPTSGQVAFGLELPQESAVEMSVIDLQGRVVYSSREHYGAGHWTLRWNGATNTGPASAGIYMVRVGAGGRMFVKRVAVMR